MYLDITTHLNTPKYLNTDRLIFEKVKLSKRDKGWGILERYMKVLKSSLFSVIKPSLVP